jgi:hypothetical protein
MDFYVERGLARDMWIHIDRWTPVSSCVDSLGTCGFMSTGETPARRARCACMSFEGKAQDRKGVVLWRGPEG